MKIYLMQHYSIEPDSEYKAEATGLGTERPVHLVAYGPTAAHALADLKSGLEELGFDPSGAEIDDAYNYLDADPDDAAREGENS
ncbi:hypothetical protein GBA63_22465 (plasmid) [Rubrobacter tropicus]|uniref:Uncharacterized protein n=1 Tax=Rubrobacter tropicus TaxID=2653851 RepID=A0A6G8QG85_9ACTN|nr:hypothetical protein [Rubrobacter tropicus]QIN85468.1 hypothetical protein GBA63_22465 [Rubrobacter tropicus]